jgi:peptide/nickel transport system ATP-binding protein
VVEQNTTRELFQSPRHPYTQGLLNSTISLEGASKSLFAIPGSIPGLESIPPGCRFAPRCPIAAAQCQAVSPELQPVGPGLAACFYTDQTALGNVWTREGQ